MNCPKIRPVSLTLTLCIATGLIGYAPQARADVFEIKSDGQWQQISQSPQLPADLSYGETASGLGRLPPVRLAAITTLGEPLDDGPAVIIRPRLTPSPYAPMINAAAQHNGISPALVDAVMWQESRYNDRAVSSAGAVGLMQLMPGTAQQLGVDPHDPWQNVFGGAAYLRKQLDRFDNNVPFALAAYNAGPGAVIKHGGIPPYAETRNYVRVIMARLARQGQ